MCSSVLGRCQPRAVTSSPGVWSRRTRLSLQSRAPDPDQSEDRKAETLRVAQFKKLKALSEKRFKAVTNFTFGSDRFGSIENGLVAHVLVGRLPSGNLIVIYGYDVWT